MYPEGAGRRVEQSPATVPLRIIKETLSVAICGDPRKAAERVVRLHPANSGHTSRASIFYIADIGTIFEGPKELRRDRTET